MSLLKYKYISTKNFDDAFYEGDTIDGISLIPGLTRINCPAGRILIETGRKIFAGMHPSIKTNMTKVYDSISGFKGYIDANSAIFSIYALNGDSKNGLDYNPRGNYIDSGVPHKGQSVFTLGDVVAGGQIYSMKTIELDSEDEYINADFSDTTYYTITLTQDTVLNALIVPPNKGTVIYIAITGDGSSELIFGENFDGLVSEIKPDLNEKITIGLISDSEKLTVISNSGTGIVIPDPIYQIITF
jgi:hypothetical protein